MLIATIRDDSVLIKIQIKTWVFSKVIQLGLIWK